MTPECNQFVFGFHPQKRREVRAQFDGGAITSDGGGLLLREVEKRIGILRQFAACFTDYRNPDLIEHQVEELVAQRVYGLALGYEDLNDHEELRHDPLLAVLVEKGDLGEKALAGKSTLNRLELTGETASRKERYKKIVLDHGAVDRLLVEVFLEAHREEPKEIILDLDATDDPLHGKPGGALFPWLLWSVLLFAVVRLLRRVPAVRAVAIVEHRCVVRKRGRIAAHRGTDSCYVAPGAHVVRGDSGFCREELMSWCEAEGVDYLLGLAKNDRLKADIAKEMEEAKAQYQETGRAARLFKEFVYQTRKSWSCARRVVAKAEHLEKGENPRFVVTSLNREAWPAQELYEQHYCARGDMGVSSQGHINQSVKVRSRLEDSSLVAWEAPWSESKTVEPSDNILRKEYAQHTRLQRTVNADVAS